MDEEDEKEMLDGMVKLSMDRMDHAWKSLADRRDLTEFEVHYYYTGTMVFAKLLAISEIMDLLEEKQNYEQALESFIILTLGECAAAGLGQRNEEEE